MWLLFAFTSAFLLGCYEVNKKVSLAGNAVIPVLFFNTLFSSLLLIPFVFLSFWSTCLDGTLLHVPVVPLETHLAVLLKAFIVLGSWIFGYFGVKHLPLTIVGPIKATQPVLTLMGAMILFGERLNIYQWIGISLAIASFYLLSSAGKKEGIRFSHNKWIYFTILSIMFGALSGLYDKHLMKTHDVMTVQVWFNIYQCIIMAIVMLTLWYPRRKKSTPFVWRWNIVFVSLFLTLADWIYFYALSDPESMISIVSMVRRSNVIVTFIAGAIFFKEKNLRSKAIDLFLVILGMLFLYWGTQT